MRFKKIFAMLLTGIMTVSMPGAVFAASTEEQIADVQAQKEAAALQLKIRELQQNWHSSSPTWHLWRARSRSLKAIWKS